MPRIARRSLLAAAAALPLPALAQAPFPNRPIRLVVPFAAGGGTDIVARIYAQKMTELLGQAMVVENRAGAGGNLGLENIARAAPDGDSLVLSSNGPVAVNRYLFRDMPIDPSRDLVPVSMTFRIEQALVVRMGLPVNSVQEFIALAKQRELTWGSGGTGSSLHLAGELFNLRAGVKLVHVPYRGGAPAGQALISGQVESMIVNGLEAMPLIQSGRARAHGSPGAWQSGRARAGSPGARACSGSSCWRRGRAARPSRGSPSARHGAIHWCRSCRRCRKPACRTTRPAPGARSSPPPARHSP